MSVIGSEILAGASGNQGYFIQRSLRFRSSASASLSRTFSGAGTSQTIGTIAFWVKRSNIGNDGRIVEGLRGGSGWQGAIDFYSSANQLRFGFGGAAEYRVQTTQVFRDPSAWYHIVVAYDTTQATASNRILMYVNGVQITSFSTANYPAQNAQSAFFNSSTTSRIGSSYDGAGSYLDSYLTEFYFIDGQALTPSSFGQTDAVTGVWTPKKYTGTYGTNGFYLPFSDNTSATTLAYDKSGNSNNWTPNNISTTAGATYDSMTDVPTLTSATAANYCVLNPLNKPSAFTLSNGNLNLSSTVDNNNCVGTFGVTSGKWYFEFVPTNMSSGASVVGIAKDSINTATYIGGSANSWGYHPNGMKYNNASGSAYGASYTDNDVIGVALDVDGGSLTFYKNGTSQGVAFSGLTAGTYFANVQSNNLGASYANFGQRPFSYTPPTGFVALNTFNLPDPTIKKGNQYMDATLWTGNGTSQSITNSGSFQPDLVWAKDRNNTGGFNHCLVDSVRGTGLRLRSNTTDAEASTSSVTAFNSNGFSIGSYPEVNQNTDSFVGWQWKESATAGFDIVTYTGNGANRTISHNLGVAPKMMIVKDRTAANNWMVYHTSLGATKYIYLETTGAAVTLSTVWNNTEPTSSVFSVGTNVTVNTNGDNYVAYLFAEIAGFSKFGSYTGNGSTDGPFVYCGFRPKYVLVKRTVTSGYPWVIRDAARNPYNTTNLQLEANSSGAEATPTNKDIDFLSNGFKIRGSGGDINDATTYIYAAFAENPFKYANAR